MDWNAIKTRGLALKDKAVDLGGKAVDKTFTALEKTAPQSYEGIKKTPFCIKDGAGLDVTMALPLAAVFVLGKDDAVSQAILVRDRSSTTFLFSSGILWTCLRLIRTSRMTENR